jgi:uncharacterized membrane protein
MNKLATTLLLATAGLAQAQEVGQVISRAAVYQQVAVTKQMPMGNATGLTEEDRALIGRWFVAGAQLD